MFPGAVNVLILLAAVLPRPLDWLGDMVVRTAGFAVTPGWVRGLELFTYIWLAACMGVAYLGKLAEPRRFGKVLSPIFVYVGGYGPLLFAITTAAYVQELRGAGRHSAKPGTTGQRAAPPGH